MEKNECWEHRSTTEGQLSTSCKSCVYNQKRRTESIPADLRCWEYLNCKEDCSIRKTLEQVTKTSESFSMLGRGKRLLIVEDSKSLRNLMKMIFEEYEYEVETAANGRMALDLISRFHPDIITCDINLTGSSLSGLDILAQVKSKNPKMKIVMVSSKSDRETVSFCLSKGANGFIQKPFKNDELVKKVFQATRSK